MVLFLLSAAQGPAECCLAVSLAVKAIQKEAVIKNVKVSAIEQEVGEQSNTIRSVFFRFEGDKAEALAKSWCGTMQWICQSPYRTNHKRKNWFFTGSYLIANEQGTDHDLSDSDLKFESCRSSGPGGQHANKTNSAVRATHIATGLVVKVQSERSQHANKRLAKALLRYKIHTRQEQQQASEKSERRLRHHTIERGNAVRQFKGMDFKDVR